MVKASSISRIGMVFVCYLFCMLITFFVLSEPIDQLWDAFDSSDFGDNEEADEHKTDLIVRIRIVMKMFWALFMALPMAWVVSKVFSREPATYYRRTKK